MDENNGTDGWLYIIKEHNLRSILQQLISKGAESQAAERPYPYQKEFDEQAAGRFKGQHQFLKMLVEADVELVYDVSTPRLSAKTDSPSGGSPAPQSEPELLKLMALRGVNIPKKELSEEEVGQVSRLCSFVSAAGAKAKSGASKKKRVTVLQLTEADFEKFIEYLEERGFKTGYKKEEEERKNGNGRDNQGPGRFGGGGRRRHIDTSPSR